MGVLSITPNYEFAAHGLLPARGMLRDPNPVVTQAVEASGPRDGPRTSYHIWDIVTGHEAGFVPEATATASSRYAAEEAAKNRKVKRRLHPIAQSVKRARR